MVTGEAAGSSSAEPLRVAVLMDTGIVSGPARQLAAVIPPLRQKGHEFLVVTFHRSGTPPSEHAIFLRDREIPHVVLEESGRFDLRLVRKVGRLLGEWNPSVVETHSYRPTALIFLLRLVRPAWRWVGFFHGVTSEDRKVRLYHWLDQKLLRFADRVVVMSEGPRALFRAVGDRVAVIHNAVVLRALGGSDSPRYLESIQSLPCPRLGVIGRLSWEKGVDLFLEAVAILARQGRPVEAVIIGDGPEEQSLRAQAKRLGVDGHVTFLGRVPVVPRTYRVLDLVVLPSRSEGMPNVLLEALAENCGVVAATVGGIPEIGAIPGAVTLVPPNRPDRIAWGIQEAIRVAANPEAQEARRRTVARFSLEHRVKAIGRLYGEVSGS